MFLETLKKDCPCGMTEVEVAAARRLCAWNFFVAYSDWRRPLSPVWEVQDPFWICTVQDMRAKQERNLCVWELHIFTFPVVKESRARAHTNARTHSISITVELNLLNHKRPQYLVNLQPLTKLQYLNVMQLHREIFPQFSISFIYIPSRLSVERNTAQYFHRVESYNRTTARVSAWHF